MPVSPEGQKLSVFQNETHAPPCLAIPAVAHMIPFKQAPWVIPMNATF